MSLPRWPNQLELARFHSDALRRIIDVDQRRGQRWRNVGSPKHPRWHDNHATRWRASFLPLPDKQQASNSVKPSIVVNKNPFPFYSPQSGWHPCFGSIKVTHQTANGLKKQAVGCVEMAHTPQRTWQRRSIPLGRGVERWYGRWGRCCSSSWQGGRFETLCQYQNAQICSLSIYFRWLKKERLIVQKKSTRST